MCPTTSRRKSSDIPSTDLTLFDRVIGWACLTLSALSAAFWIWIFEFAYWRHRDCFNEAGRCLQDGVVFHEQSALAYLILIGLSAVGVLIGLVLIRLRSRQA